MPVPVENSSVPALHLTYLAKSGCPHPNPEPKGYFTDIVPQVSWHVPFIGIGFTAAEMVKWMGRERRM